MSRRKATKPADRVSFHWQTREYLPSELARSAKENGVTMNIELNRRLEASLRSDALRTIDAVAADLSKTWARVRKQIQAAE